MAQATTQAVILAAGLGGRLLDHTNGRPKCLVPVLGRPLIDYVLSSLRQAGIGEVLVVVGHHGDQVEAYVCDGARYDLRVSYARNEDYSRGNASSLITALPHLEQPFLLVMSDHLCEPSLLQTLLDHDASANAIAIDRTQLSEERTDEATKVALVGERVVDLGKQLERWHAIDTGFSRWTAGAFLGASPDGELSALMAGLASNGSHVTACDVTGHAWLDVDTEEDLHEAERLVRSHGRIFA